MIIILLKVTVFAVHSITTSVCKFQFQTVGHPGQAGLMLCQTNLFVRYKKGPAAGGAFFISGGGHSLLRTRLRPDFPVILGKYREYSPIFSLFHSVQSLNTAYVLAFSEYRC